MLSKEELKKLHGKKYVDSFVTNQSKLRLERLINSVPLSPEYKVVDFGCGNGMLFTLLSNKVDSYTGIDFSEEFIKAAIKEYSSTSNAEFICADISEFCSKNKEVYDLAFAMDLSEHIYDKEWVNILIAIHSSLKNGGMLYIHTPNADFFLEKMKSKDFIVKQFPEHIAVRNIYDNCKLLKNAGFEINKTNLIPHYNILRLFHPISFIPVIGRYFKARIFIEAIKNRVPNL
ncbi:MAG: class I SAM-dependent methyltransferase [Candidatus Electrothrix sp. AU1_5]|nr:class I SAM-dependent methyltransferase [Candidatus Electrothrix gigas]